MHPAVGGVLGAEVLPHPYAARLAETTISEVIADEVVVSLASLVCCY
jgi:hypothetical protein